jgi:DNA-binding NarL/FixJ family response regulator
MRILVVEDAQLVRSAIVTLLKTQPEFEVVGEAEDGLTAVAKAKELKCDVVLMDISLPGINGFSATRMIRHLVPDCQVLFVSQHLNTGILVEALRTGASGYVVKTDVMHDLLNGIRAVGSRKTFLSKSCASVLPGRGEGGAFPANNAEN